MSERERRGIETALIDLGRHLDFPETPDLVASVGAELRSRPEGAEIVPLRPPRTAPPRVRRVALLVAASLLLVLGGLTAFVPAVRAAVVRILTLGAVRIEIGEVASPQPSLVPSPRDLDLGERVTFEVAASEARFPVGVPAVLGAPDAVYIDELPSGRIVWLAYEPRAGLPEAEETGIGLLLGEFVGRTEADFVLKKLPPEGVVVEEVSVGGNRAYWLSGPLHELLFLDRLGEVIADRTRLAGNTLIWTEGDVTYRLESALGQDEAIRIAESLE